MPVFSVYEISKHSPDGPFPLQKGESVLTDMAWYCVISSHQNKQEWETVSADFVSSLLHSNPKHYTQLKCKISSCFFN